VGEEKVDESGFELKSGSSKIRVGSMELIWSATDGSMSKPSSEKGRLKVVPPQPVSQASTKTPTKKKAKTPISKKKKVRMEEDKAVFNPEPSEEDVNEVCYVPVEGTLWGIASRPASTDVSQGQLNNCYLVAALATLADNFPDGIRAAVKKVNSDQARASGDGTPAPPSSATSVGSTSTSVGSTSTTSLYEVTFQLPSRAKRNSTVGTEGTQTVVVDNRFFVPKKMAKARKRKSTGGKGKALGMVRGSRRGGRGGTAETEEKEEEKEEKVEEVEVEEEEEPEPTYSTCDTHYMRSATSALWPLLMEKAWVKVQHSRHYIYTHC
jgi:hypothetical protein